MGVHLEHPAQPGSTENPQETAVLGDEPEPAPPRPDPVPGPTQDAQAGAVDEGDEAQVEHPSGRGPEDRASRPDASEIAATRSISPYSVTTVVPSIVRTETGGAGRVRFSDMVRTKPLRWTVRKGRSAPAGWAWWAHGYLVAAVCSGPRPALGVARPAQATLLDTGQAGLAGQIRRESGARLVLAVDPSQPKPGSATDRVE